MLDVDAPGVRLGQLADELFEGWGVLGRIGRQHGQHLLRLRLQPSGGQFLRVLLRVLGEDDLPAH